jgi:carboxymethylenebutenolidase
MDEPQPGLVAGITEKKIRKSLPDGTGKIAATGFCYGGSMSNTLAVLLGADLAATAPFYGGAPKAEDVPKIKAAILIHHGALDKNLAEAYPAQEAELKKNNIRYEGHIYPNSVHGFFNDATPERYNKAAAEQAWNRTIEWFNQYARGG